jgi:hypothetical protein
MRRILLIAGLAAFSATFGLSQSVNPSTSTAPANGPFGGPILVTPTASFPTPAPTAGISDAGRAGISVENPAIIPPESTIGANGTTPGNPNGVAPAESNEVASGPTDLSGPSVAVTDSAGGPAPATSSLAEISSLYKAEKNTRNARVLGNEDVEKMLSNKGGVTMAKNMPPLGPGALEHSAQPQDTSTQAAVTPNPAPSVPQTTQTDANPQEQNGLTSQTGAQSSSENQNAAPATSAENATTPQINRNQQANDAQGGRRLPATATFLPMLGLLGLASGGIGFWFRKFRK